MNGHNEPCPEQPPITSPLRFVDEASGREIPSLAARRDIGLLRPGDVVRAAGTDGKRHYRILSLRAGPEPCMPGLAVVAEATPARGRALLLAALLVLSWFGLSAVFDWLF